MLPRCGKQVVTSRPSVLMSTPQKSAVQSHVRIQWDRISLSEDIEKGVEEKAKGARPLVRERNAEYYAVGPLARLLIKARSALFTAVASGNSAATSAASNTKLVPSANRAAYFPRTPPEKSYSARIFSRTLARFGLLGFFILYPFPTAGGSSADDTGDAAAFDVSDDHEQLLAGPTNQDQASLITRTIRICNRDRKRIRKRSCRVGKAYSVLS